MKLERDLVLRSLAIFENRHIGDADASELARVLGSKQEFVAHLFLRGNVMTQYRGLASEVRKVAAEIYTDSVSVRGHAGQLSRWNEGAAEMRKCLAALLARERSQQDVTKRVCDAFTELAHHSRSEGIALDIQWRVGPEKGDR